MTTLFCTRTKMDTTSIPQKEKTTSAFSELMNYKENGIKFIRTHQSNIEVLERFLKEMESLSDLAKTVKKVTVEELYSTN